jgi:hypothetical protein
LPEPVEPAGSDRHQTEHDEAAARHQVARDAHDDLRRHRQLGAVAEFVEELGKLRHDPEDDERDDDGREQDQHDGVNQCRDHLAAHRLHDFDVLNVATDNLLEAAALLP